MNIKKALTYIAFGFAFTLINFNLTISNVTINIMPDFIGWILILLGINNLTDYVDRPILKWGSVVMIIITLASWLLDIAKPELNIPILKTIITFLTAGYMYFLFELLIKVGNDYKAKQTSTLATLKIVYVGVYTILAIVSILLEYFSVNNSLFLFTLVILMLALSLAIVTLVTLFGLRNEVISKL